jgi:hypothetical protein
MSIRRFHRGPSCPGGLCDWAIRVRLQKEPLKETHHRFTLRTAPRQRPGATRRDRQRSTGSRHQARRQTLHARRTMHLAPHRARSRRWVCTNSARPAANSGSPSSAIYTSSPTNPSPPTPTKLALTHTSWLNRCLRASLPRRPIFLPDVPIRISEVDNRSPSFPSSAWFPPHDPPHFLHRRLYCTEAD